LPTLLELGLLERHLQFVFAAQEDVMEVRITAMTSSWIRFWLKAVVEQLVEQLPAAQATALRAAAAQLQISPMAVQRAQKKALAARRQQLVGGG
jgi:hypothetical protein